jgi:predicted DNA-binding transcriptional regulator AlpA
MNLLQSSFGYLPEGVAYIPSDQMSACLGISKKTLARWRCEGRGPDFVKIGRQVYYRSDTVRSWLDAATRSHT